MGFPRNCDVEGEGTQTAFEALFLEFLRYSRGFKNSFKNMVPHS